MNLMVAGLVQAVMVLAPTVLVAMVLLATAIRGMARAMVPVMTAQVAPTQAATDRRAMATMGAAGPTTVTNVIGQDDRNALSTVLFGSEP
jgi:hypothetical protein